MNYIVMLAMVLLPIASLGAPGYGEPLNCVTGVIYRVGTVAALKSAVVSASYAGVPATILISNGVYVIDIQQLHVYGNNIIIRSLSGDRDAVVIRGPNEGPSASLLNVFLVSGSNVTMADLTLGWCRWHGIQVCGEEPSNASGLWVHNCRLVNCNEQFIKGSVGSDPEGATDGLVENCLFEFTSGWSYQYYTGGIDVHKGVNWTVRDNLFKNLRTSGSGLTEHAVHFWNPATRSQNLVVERNLILNCDRGIGFGLGYGGGVNGGNSIIRNNFIYNNGAGPNTDVGIGLEEAYNVKVDNNTVFILNYASQIEYRFPASSNLFIRNNLVNGNIRNRDGSPAPVLANNLAGAQASWFRNATNGDLHVLPGISNVIDQGFAIEAGVIDLDGHPRPCLGGWDIGADEYDPERSDTDFDGMMDAWEARYHLDTQNGNDASLDSDEDGVSNLQEWIADTNPAEGAEFFRLQGLDWSSGCVLEIGCTNSRNYSLLYCTNLPKGVWAPVVVREFLAGHPEGSLRMTDSQFSAQRYYRVEVTVPVH